MGGATYRTHLNAKHAIYLIRSNEGLTLEKSASETPYQDVSWPRCFPLCNLLPVLSVCTHLNPQTS